MQRLTVSVLLGLLALAGACSKDPEQAKREYFESGNRYYAAGKFKEASVEYRNAVQQDQRFGEARFKLAETYAQLADAPNAYREYIRAADLLPNNVDAQLKAGTMLLLAGQFEDAKARAARALQVDPKRVDAQVLHANATAGLKDVTGAIEEINEAISLDPSKGTTYANLGALEQLRGNQAEAEAAYKKAVETDPKSVGAQLAYANFLLSSGRTAEAEAAIQVALQVEPTHVLANRAMAVLFIGSNRAAEAEPYLKKVAEASPGGDARLQLADYYVSRKRAPEALAILEKLSGEQPYFVQARTRIASIQFSQGQRAEASKTIDEVLAKQPTNATALLAKARLLMDEQKPNEALAKAKAATNSDPRLMQAHYLLGTLYASRGDADEATKSFREVLKLNPRAVPAQLQLSQIELARGSATASLELAQDAVDSQPGNPLARLILARSLTARGELNRAEEEIKNLLAKHPNVAAVHAQAGLIALTRGDDTSARRSFEKAAELDPNSLEALTGLVTLDVQAKQTAEAVKRVEAQLSRTTPTASLYMLAARTQLANKDMAAAEQSLRRCIELDGTMLQAYGLLGQLYIRQQKPEQAIAEFERMVTAQPKNVRAHTMIAMILQAQGKSGEAQKRYEQVMQIDSRAAVAANNLAWMYAENGVNLDQALQLAQTAKSVLPEVPEVNDTLGFVYLKKDLATLAVAPFRMSIEKDPKNPLYHYRLGLAYSKTGDKTAARKALQDALRLNEAFPGADDARQLLASLQG